MADEPVLVENLPDVQDIRYMLKAIEGMGAIVDRIDAHTVRINRLNNREFMYRL